MTTTVLLMTFVGGTGNFWGPIRPLSTLFFKMLSDITDRWPLFMGLIFIVMVLTGLSQIILSIRTRFVQEDTGKPVAAEGSSS